LTRSGSCEINSGRQLRRVKVDPTSDPHHVEFSPIPHTRGTT